MDGFGAAFAAWLKFKDDAVYISVSYGTPPPDFSESDKLYILDFSYPVDVLRDRAASGRARQVVVLDHHKTAEADLQGLPSISELRDDPDKPGVFVHFDMNESGATLAWKFFHAATLMPRLFRYLRDRDLWLWRLAWSREFSAGLSSHPFDFKLWASLCDESIVDNLVREGTAILRAQKQRVHNLCKHVMWLSLAGDRVPCVNATSDFSEVGDYLCEQYPEARFGASFTVRNDGKIQWSLRSRNGFDVSAVAKQFGGGGHKAAAGFVTDAPDVNPRKVN